MTNQPVHIVVVGAGNAGIPAAISAAERGARVTLIEKTDRIGGMLWTSSATVSGAGTRMQRAKGIEDSPEQHAKDALEIGRGRNNPAIVRLATEYAAETIDWLESIGAPYSEDSPVFAAEHEFYSVPRSYRCGGKEYIAALEPELRKWQDAGLVDVCLGTRVVDLLTTGDRVSGVRVDHDGTTEDIQADAVILSTGGYGASQELIRRFHGDKHVATACLDHATGDGIKLVESVNGALTNTDLLILMPGGVEDPRHPGFTLSWLFLTKQRTPATAGDLWVNNQACRFIREDEQGPDARERAIMSQPQAEMFAIFDQPMKDGLTPEVAQVTTNLLSVTDGWLVSAPTIRDLAVTLGLDPETLQATVDEYNSSVDQGRDDAFGRTGLPKKIDTGPFYAVPACGVTLGTNGGVKVDDRLRVVREDGTPIDGLYAAGELLGKAQLMGDGVASGFAAGPAFTFGRLAPRFAIEAAQPAAAGRAS